MKRNLLQRRSSQFRDNTEGLNDKYGHGHGHGHGSMGLMSWKMYMDGHEYGYEYGMHGYMDAWLADITAKRKIKEVLVQWNPFLLQAFLSLLLTDSLILSLLYFVRSV